MKIFFSGIGGSGVSAIAGFMADRGAAVSGSDRLFDADPGNHICTRLRSNGIVIVPQDGTGIDKSIDLAVFSTAVEEGNTEYRKVSELGILKKSRPEYLADIVARFRTIAVAGTSGKSTISGMLAFLMKELGMEPNFIGGGRAKQFRSDKNPGNYLAGRSDLLVVEACESDGTLISYRPSFSIISNLDLDHHEIAETARMFEQLSANTREFVLLGGDDKNLAACKICGAKRFSIDVPSEYRAEDIRHNALRTTFSVNKQRFELNLPGRHNLYNALACIAFLSELGIASDKVANVLPGFTGIERRFDLHLDEGRFLVIDDYAHNPHKIGNLMKTMSGISNSVCYIYQPHGFGPTRLMKNGYIRVFSENLRDSDHLVLLPIYYAGGTAAKDISSKDLSKGISSSGRSVQVIEDRTEIFGMIGKWDSYVVFGARDDSLSALAEAIADRLRQKPTKS